MTQLLTSTALGLGLIIDSFAGGGGASTGIEAALGAAVDIAINHDDQAIRMHQANHPGTVHINSNIWQVDPRDVVRDHPSGIRHVSLAWFSPDCKHFSKAKGGKPREKSIRDLAWVVVLWAQKVQPDVILLENVEEFRTWGPLCDEGKPIKERAGETFELWSKQLRKAGYKIQWKELRACDYGAPTIRKRFFMIARRDGLPIAWPAPTHGKPGTPDVLSGKLKPWRSAAEIIDWSIPCPSIFERKKPLAEKTLRRIAHGIMKFVVNNPSPFIVPGRNVAPHITKFRNGAIGHDMADPLATVTANSYLKRPGGCAPLGLVEASLAPIITYAQQGGANRSVENPHHTICANSKDQNCVAAAHLVHIGNGEREARYICMNCGCGPFTDPHAHGVGGLAPAECPACGEEDQIVQTEPAQAPRAMDEDKPLGTVVAGSIKHHAVMAFMQKFAENGKGYDPETPLHTVMAGAPRHAIVTAHIEQANGGPNNNNLAGRAAGDPLSTVATSGSQQRLVTSNLIKLRGTSEAHLASSAESVEEPLPTVSAGGTHMAEVRAFLIKYYGNEQDGHGLDNPLGTVTVQDRFGLITVQIAGEEYVIVDIGMRMLTPRELFNAQGFPADYIIDCDATGAPITKTAQVAKCGNSVCPPLSEALVRSQFPSIVAMQEVKAA